MQWILPLLAAILGLAFFNFLMGYRKGHITIDLDDRYIDFNRYVKAIASELESQGHTVEYKGSRRFNIDGKSYTFIERNISMGGVPLQRTILKPAKGDR
ncbi:hypothetical protein [Bacillus marinisedimentorum]|uniref:hypothetical protein n=1 Tax=Bacillus marinisedimentorum TaxID=1821260 RepID=UPI0007E013EE|nr:hypothetical protein [Bacillus marinisedimentorum]